MKFDETLAKIETDGLGQRQTFGVALNKKTFDVIVNSQYKNIYRAVLIELYQNAHDSHIRAGKTDRPVEITLPTALEPNLIVKDYGIGMSHEFIMTRYVTVFDSTKNDTDNEDGGYGWGRLVALSFSGNYTLISTHNGRRNTYFIFFNERQIPDITLVNSEPTENENGVEVIVNIPIDKIGFFKAEIQSVFEFCHVAPLMTNYNDEIQLIKNREWFYQSELGMVDIQNRYVTPQVWSGIYGYPIDKNQLNLTQRADYLTRNFKSVFAFRIGEIRPTAARDALIYNEGSKKLLTERIEAFTAEVREYTLQKLRDATDIWSFISAGEVFRNIWGERDSTVLFKGYSSADFHYKGVMYNGMALSINKTYTLTEGGGVRHQKPKKYSKVIKNINEFRDSIIYIKNAKKIDQRMMTLNKPGTPVILVDLVPNDGDNRIELSELIKLPEISSIELPVVVKQRKTQPREKREYIGKIWIKFIDSILGNYTLVPYGNLVSASYFKTNGPRFKLIVIPLDQNKRYNIPIKQEINVFYIQKLYPEYDLKFVFMKSKDIPKLVCDYQLFNDFWKGTAARVSQLSAECYLAAQRVRCKSIGAQIIRSIVPDNYHWSLWPATGVKPKLNYKTICKGVFYRRKYLFEIQPVSQENAEKLIKEITGKDLTFFAN